MVGSEVIGADIDGVQNPVNNELLANGDARQDSCKVRGAGMATSAEHLDAAQE